MKSIAARVAFFYLHVGRVRLLHVSYPKYYDELLRNWIGLKEGLFYGD